MNYSAMCMRRSVHVAMFLNCPGDFVGVAKLWQHPVLHFQLNENSLATGVICNKPRYCIFLSDDPSVCTSNCMVAIYGLYCAAGKAPMHDCTWCANEGDYSQFL